MFSYMQFLSFNLSLLFALYEMKSRIYKAKSGDAPQVPQMTARKAAGIILGELYRGLWPWLLGAKPSPRGESHVNKAQFTCETRTFQDAEAQGQQHDGSTGPSQENLDLAMRMEKKGQGSATLWGKSGFKINLGSSSYSPKNQECQRMKDRFEGQRLAHLTLVNFLPSQKASCDNSPFYPSSSSWRRSRLWVLLSWPSSMVMCPQTKAS